MATSGHSGDLKIADLKDVKSALWDARAKWKNIGSCTGVDEGTLETMKGKDGDCLNGILTPWLGGVHNPKKKNSKPRTWHTVIEALRDKILNEEAMANKLEKVKLGDPDTNQDWKKIVISILVGITTCICIIILMQNVSNQLLGFSLNDLFLCVLKITIIVLVVRPAIGVVVYAMYIIVTKVSNRKLGFALCYLFLCALPVVLPQVTLNGTIIDGGTVCPGQVITFTCETRGSERLVWLSDNYIGKGSRLEYADYNDINLIHTGAPGTVAVLMKNTIVNGTITLVSQLTIQVPDSEISSNPSVSCVHVRDNTRKIINFKWLNFGKPEMQRDIILVEQRRRTIAMNTCMLYLFWKSPVNYNLEYLSGYMINIDGENIVNKTDNLNSSLSFITLFLYCGIHNVSVQAIDICDRVSNSTPVVTVTPERFPFSLITPDPIAIAPECSESTTRDTLPSIILGGLLCVVILIFEIIIVALVIALWKSKYKRTFKLNQQKSDTQFKEQK